MGSPTSRFLKQNNTLLFTSFMILFLSCVPDRTNFCSNLSSATTAVETRAASSNIHFSFRKLSLDGFFSFNNIYHAAKDFGNTYHFHPFAVLYPKSVSDVSSTIKHVFNMGSASQLTVAARGHGHSLHGQAQTHQGVVINMMSLQEPVMQVHTDMPPFVDVSGGELWIKILNETLKQGLTPKSWTDYLHVTVGGTLSNAGISGQAFLHGPQINNVYQLEVVTGKGDVVNCSEQQNADLFYGVLGGLGQFGIITRARISLEPAPKMVKWIRVLYSEFSAFSKDQEHLISLENSFDYIEGFVQINRTGLLNNWRSSFNPREPLEVEKLNTDGKVLYCLEMAKYFNPEEANITFEKTDSLLSELSFLPSTLFQSDVTYLNFLERVHISEKKLRKEGKWEAPHPWLNLLIPRSKISDFAHEVFGKIVKDSSNGPILIYPVNKSKWIKITSFATPDEDVFYLVGFLTSAVSSSTGTDGLDYIIKRNQRILDFCTRANLGTKQYLPYYSTQKEWQAHFGPKWEQFVRRKSAYDPLAILAPGQRIFQKAIPILYNTEIYP